MQHSSTHRNLRILIVGGGIAGTTLANLLEQQGLVPVLVEKEPTWSCHGYALALWPLGSRVLRGLGLYEAFCDISQRLEWYRIFDQHRRAVHAIHLSAHLSEADMIRMVAREELLLLLANRLRATEVQFATVPERIEQRGDEVEVTFTSGEHATFDLVVGCDGMHSTVRHAILGAVPATPTHWAGWAWWTQASEVPKDTVCEYWAPGRFFETYSTRDATSVLAAMPIRRMPVSGHPPSHEAVRQAFGQFGGDVLRVLEALSSDDRIYYWDFTDVRCLRWHRGRVVLLGDASSALLPTAGVGASCAMESAAVLADELRRVDAATVEQALPLYFRRRFTRVDRMQRESRLIARLMFMESALLCRIRNWVLRTTPFAESRLKAIERLLGEPL
jgi:2-polyprenyl-6-methoxyphenol hydroxylase-like FAD-dependent oxidoreductase